MATTDETVGQPVGAKWRYLVLDLWMATGREPAQFDAFVEEHGDALVWSLLLGEVRDAPRCWQPLDGDDWCVLSDGHKGSHYGADDVAAPVFLPRPTRHQSGR